MVGSVKHEVLPGGLSDLDRGAIVELFESGLKATRIARSIRKHPSTVQWFLYCQGFTAPRYLNRGAYWRGGRLVTPFTADEDAFIEAQRVQGCGPREIARRASAQFGTQRSLHTIRCRLVMLAARESVDEAA